MLTDLAAQTRATREGTAAAIAALEAQLPELAADAAAEVPAVLAALRTMHDQLLTLEALATKGASP